MKTSKSNLNSLAVLHVLGALTPAEEEKFARQLSADEAAARLVDECHEAAALLALSLEPVPPPAHVRASLLAAIAATNPTDSPQETPAIRVVDADDGWQDYPIDGIRFKQLTPLGQTGPVTVLMTMKPGARYPGHEHTGPEQCLVVSGSFESAGNVRRAGDFIYAEAGTADEELYSPGGAILLVVMAYEDFAKAG